MKIIKTKIEPKKAIICKNVNLKYLRKDINNTHIPEAGDVAIFRIKGIGKHTRVQTTSGNNAFILPGDYINAAFGNRYASQQFEGYIPEKPSREYHILGQGGVIGHVASQHQRFDLIGPTICSLVGYVTDDQGKVINTKRIIAEPPVNGPVNCDAKIILSLGSSMDSGKTTSAGFLARGLKKAGKRIVYIKLTGTAYTRDKRFVNDYGADMVIDFSDLGFPSTYMCGRDELIDLYRKLLLKACAIHPDYIVMEIADGLLQRETEMYLSSDEIKNQIYGVIFSAGDSLSAVHGSILLSNHGYNILAITGLFTTSPLLIKEVKAHTDIPVLLEEDLVEKTVIPKLKL